MAIKDIKAKTISYNQAIANEICNEISCSSKGIRVLCKDNPNWPSAKTIFQWRIKHKDFGEQYARAKEHQIQSLVDEIIDIADDTSQDFIQSEDGKLKANQEHINRSRLRIDTRKWLAAKLCPRLYGNKVSDQPPMETLLEKLIDKL